MAQIFEDVQLGVQGLRFVDVLPVFAGPMKGLTFGMLNPARIDAATGHHGFVFGGEVFSHHRDHSDIGEVAGRQ